MIAEQPPSGLPVAADPTAGYTPAELAAAGYPSGTALTHPRYSDFTDPRNWNDVGVIVLDKPASGVAPAPIAPLNTLDRYAQPVLKRTTFRRGRLRHRGPQVRVRPVEAPAHELPPAAPVHDLAGQKLTPQILQLNGNPNDVRGGGGTCFGDSGGPVILHSSIVAVTS